MLHISRLPRAVRACTWQALANSKIHVAAIGHIHPPTARPYGSREILRSGQGQAGGNDTLDRGILRCSTATETVEDAEKPALAKFMKSTTFSMEPFLGILVARHDPGSLRQPDSSKSFRKKRAVSMFTPPVQVVRLSTFQGSKPIAPKTMLKFSWLWSCT